IGGEDAANPGNPATATPTGRGNGRAMNPAAKGKGDSSPRDPALDDLVEGLTNRLKGGQEIDLEGVVAGHPAQPDELGRLWPILRRVAGLSEAGTADAEGTGLTTVDAGHPGAGAAGPRPPINPLTTLPLLELTHEDKPVALPARAGRYKV